MDVRFYPWTETGTSTSSVAVTKIKQIFVQGRRTLTMDVLQNLSTFTEHWSLDSLIELSALAKLVASEYETRKADLPTNIHDQMSTLDIVIKSKLSAAKAKKIRDLKLRIDGLKSKDEKKIDYEKELAALTAE